MGPLFEDMHLCVLRLMGRGNGFQLWLVSVRGIEDVELAEDAVDGGKFYNYV